MTDTVVSSGIIPASNLQPGDRFWNSHRHQWCPVVEIDPRPTYDGVIFVAFEYGPDHFGHTWLDADSTVAVQLPRDNTRERATTCKWCRGETWAHNRVCDRHECRQAEARTVSVERDLDGLARSRSLHPSNGGGNGGAA